jgi:ubiquinone/menaquinone biosynthesis C-methylase UbiE
MTDAVAVHYGGRGDLAQAIAASLERAGKNLDGLTTADLAGVDEFHIRGRKATLELAGQMNLRPDSHVLDIGSGLGGAARALAEAYGCRVTGIDLTEAFCEAANALSDWLGLSERTVFQRGDATDLPFADRQFDAALTVHAAMNIPAKSSMYEEARRILKPGAIFAIYDVLRGEGGEVLFPVPWARESSISHLATPDETRALLADAGFEIQAAHDSTAESQAWFAAMAKRMARAGPPPVTFQAILGDDFPEMARNQVRNLAERRIRTVSYICRA